MTIAINAAICRAALADLQSRNEEARAMRAWAAPADPARNVRPFDELSRFKLVALSATLQLTVLGDNLDGDARAVDH
jgi:hypothetical protein